ncbi:hypothetical protein [Dendronalium sp. ChiSLP03b]|uniref:COG3650 family protein n=1 Tax=Dendronalium sp. ChiSLP03b TaxID=3075381 RepID=UPI002AD4B4D6|nr:hypothetical protein [Dendronalium sp. ChiSLP03b]MDZ8203225.1 hypothetical protein [Dendronalium sp. ChiSLP03b]
MKALVSCLILLGFGASLMADSPSTANSNSLIVAETASSENFIARGTEPFWSITISKQGIVYSTPDVKKQTFPYVTPLKAQGRPADLVRVYRLRGRGNNTLILKKVSVCSDGMSDKNYPYSAIFIRDNMVLEGCAEQQ